ncbi:hypothetical protein [Anaeromyxobacter oryzae]|uniref:Uncharacterized protein n=1 Tax=Anaeromyxobacter oryzae TaxID=2918170 RepID=A0ABM7WQ11_9BACT|nr:hypothetical protein [Anaeromyxobacter oryzae]BDG01553.1 hypothetical protein AMOR_05490 [Anaeromyxobacter oryzae]
MGIFIPTSAFFVEEQGIFVARPDAVLSERGDPAFVRVESCIYRYSIKG